MLVIGMLAGLAIILLVLVDAFETTVLPRRVTHRYRFARLFYRSTWEIWCKLAFRLRPGKPREAYLSMFGPLSLLGLLATWVLGLILGFALLHWSLETALHAPERNASLSSYLYWSGGTFFTLGYGDITPVGLLGRLLAVVEAGLGFGFLAMIIGYLPVIYQTFSSREVTISLLDARAGSPPSAAQLLLRLARANDLTQVSPLLSEWEHWAAELLESHLSFPVLSYYRSQHDNQSWLAAVTTMLDACTFFMFMPRCPNRYQAQLTFAMARHAVVDLALVLKTPPQHSDPERLTTEELQSLREKLCGTDLALDDGASVETQLSELRATYEPFAQALSRRFLIALPAIVPETERPDNWQTSAWMPRTPGIGSLPQAQSRNGHFD